MDNFICLDLEASCNDEPRMDSNEMEIIEIGACLVNASGQILSQFQTFVKPSLPAPLTPFCTALTSITQADVDSAPGFVQAIEAFEAWIDSCKVSHGPIGFWGSWGGYDKNQFERNARLIDAPVPSFLGSLEHKNLKAMYGKAVGLGKKAPGLGKALNCEGIRFVGVKHRGIDDALNIAKIAGVSLGLRESVWRDRPALKTVSGGSQ
jgi:inhibitor of KinA sporulation pathway (predicted exonuclease)